MKRLLTLLFALVVAFSLSMPAFAQEAAGQEAAPKAEKKEKKAKKAKKAKKEKKQKKEEKKEGGGQ
jgi:ABC-type transporter MlaC component